jgi:ABC-type nitrate/sulfonate/bicarbonate transport system permease component
MRKHRIHRAAKGEKSLLPSIEDAGTVPIHGAAIEGLARPRNTVSDEEGKADEETRVSQSLGVTSTQAPPIDPDSPRWWHLRDADGHLPRWVGGAIGIGMLFVIWELLAVITVNHHHVIPTPQSVAVTIVHDPGYSVWTNMWITAQEAALGWLWGNAIALTLALVFLLVPVLEGPLLKLALASYCMPVIAIGPILYVILSGSAPRIAVSALSVIFTTLVGVLVGLRSADKVSLDMVRAYGGGRWAQLSKVRLKAALPATFTGLAIAGPAAVLGAIIGEYLGGQTGLGTTMVLAEQAFDIARVWAIAAVATGMAGVAYLATMVVGRLATPWVPRGRTSR